MTASCAAVLIVEDELIVASDLQQTLSDMGYDPFAIAASGEEALACASTRRPDVVLMDIRIKGRDDGIQTAALLKRHHPVSVIFLTANADESMVERAKRTAPDGYLVKPVQSAELRCMIEVALFRRELESEKDRRRATEHRLHTERERLSAALRGAHAELETILNAVPASITSWDAGLHNRFANTTARNRIGMASDHPTGGHMRDIMGERGFLKVQPLVERALRGGQVSGELIEENGPGDVRYTNYSFVPEIDAKGVVGLYALAFDITELRRSHDQIRQLARRLENVREEERRAVAVILHDGIAQDLFALKLGFDHLARQTKRRSALNRVCEELRQSIAKCMDDTRTIANDLRPVALDCAGVGAVIAQHARNFAVRSALTIRVFEEGTPPPLQESVRLLLFRAAQEALTNVAKHARASTVDIHLQAQTDHIILRVTDDGIGVAAGSLRKPQSLGLLGLRERVEALGGELTLTRRVPAGTRLTLQLPLRPDVCGALN